MKIVINGEQLFRAVAMWSMEAEFCVGNNLAEVVQYALEEYTNGIKRIEILKGGKFVKMSKDRIRKKLPNDLSELLFKKY